jgi:uncharacterized alkaline shock family protein YloU
VASATETPPPERAGGSLPEQDISRVVRAAALSCYGVAAVSARRWTERLLAFVGRGSPGVTVAAEPRFTVEVNLSISPNVPRAQVAANVADAIRYAVHREFGRSIDQLTVLVDGQPLAAGSP